jgi:hypothetical protein
MEATLCWLILALLILVPIQGIIWMGMLRANDERRRILIYTYARKLAFGRRRRR